MSIESPFVRIAKGKKRTLDLKLLTATLTYFELLWLTLKYLELLEVAYFDGLFNFAFTWSYLNLLVLTSWYFELLQVVYFGILLCASTPLSILIKVCNRLLTSRNPIMYSAFLCELPLVRKWFVAKSNFHKLDFFISTRIKTLTAVCSGFSRSRNPKISSLFKFQPPLMRNLLHEEQSFFGYPKIIF